MRELRASLVTDGLNSVDSNPVDLAAAGITKRFGGLTALHDVAIRCKAGSVTGLVGENGSGKSTLIRILGGALRPDVGEVTIGDQAVAFRSPREAYDYGVSTVFQELSLMPDLSVAGNLLYGFEPRSRLGRINVNRMDVQATELMRGLGVTHVPAGRLARSLSIGDRQLIEIMKAIRRAPRVLLLDEPTSALLPAQVEWLAAQVRRIAEAGTVVVFVSHRLRELRQFCDDMIVLRNGRAVLTGQMSSVADGDLVEAMLGKAQVPAQDATETAVIESHDPACVLRGLASTPHLNPTDLIIRRGEILGVGGLQGQGQQALFQALFGLRRRTGEIVLGGKRLTHTTPTSMLAAGMALVPEDRATEGLCLTLSVRDNLFIGSFDELSAGGWLPPRKVRSLVRWAVDSFGIRVQDARQPVGSLSGGNQQKVLLARVLARRPQLLLLYDPTRGVDVGARAEIYELVRREAERGVGILWYSSDTAELTQVCDRVVVFGDGGIVADLRGSAVTEANIVAASVGARYETG